MINNENEIKSLLILKDNKKKNQENFIILIQLLVLDIIYNNFNIFKYIFYSIIFYINNKNYNKKYFNLTIILLFNFILFILLFEQYFINNVINMILIISLFNLIDLNLNKLIMSKFLMIIIFVEIIYNTWFSKYFNLFVNIILLIFFIKNKNYSNIIVSLFFFINNLNYITKIFILFVSYSREKIFFNKLNSKISSIFFIILFIIIILNPFLIKEQSMNLEKKLGIKNNLKNNYKYYLDSYHDNLNLKGFYNSKIIDCTINKYNLNKINRYLIKTKTKIDKIKIFNNDFNLVKKFKNFWYNENTAYLGYFKKINKFDKIKYYLDIKVFDAISNIRIYEYEFEILDYNVSKNKKRLNICYFKTKFKIVFKKRHYNSSIKKVKCKQYIKVHIYLLPKDKNLLKINKFKDIEIKTNNKILIENKNYIIIKNDNNLKLNLNYYGKKLFKNVRIENENGIKNILLFSKINKFNTNENGFKNYLTFDINKINNILLKRDINENEIQIIEMPDLSIENYEIDEYLIENCKIDNLVLNIDINKLKDIQEINGDIIFSKCFNQEILLKNIIIKHIEIFENYKISKGILKIIYNKLEIKNLLVKKLLIKNITPNITKFNDYESNKVYINNLNINNAKINNFILKNFYVYIPLLNRVNFNKIIQNRKNTNNYYISFNKDEIDLTNFFLFFNKNKELVNNFNAYFKNNTIININSEDFYINSFYSDYFKIIA